MSVNEPRCLPDGTIQDSIKVNIPAGAAVRTQVILPNDTFMLQFIGNGNISITSEDAVSAGTYLQFPGVPGTFYAVGPDCDRVIVSHNVANMAYIVVYKVNPRAESYTGRY
jgi:hypothetical protein